MTVKRNYAIAIATLADYFSHPLSKLQEIARNSDWSGSLCCPVVIGRSNYFGISFQQSLKSLYSEYENLYAIVIEWSVKRHMHSFFHT